MSDVYRIFGAELSPFSVKIRSYFRYKKIPHQWIQRDSDSMADYQKFAKIGLDASFWRLFSMRKYYFLG